MQMYILLSTELEYIPRIMHKVSYGLVYQTTRNLVHSSGFTHIFRVHFIGTMVIIYLSVFKGNGPKEYG